MISANIDQLNSGIRGFDRLYGLEFTACSDTEVRARLEVREEVTQPYGLIHGGVYASMAESMASLATALGVAEQGCMAMGLSNSTSFLRPITEGVVEAVATRMHRGRTTWVWDVRFTDSQERLCAADADDDRGAPGAGRAVRWSGIASDSGG